MINELIYELYRNYRAFSGGGAVIVLYVLSCLVVAKTSENVEKKHIPILLAPVCAIGIAMSEFIGKAFEKTGKKRAEDFAKGALVICICLIAIVSSGRMIMSPEFSVRSENEMHIPDDILRSAISLSEGGKKCRVITMPGWEEYYRSISSNIDVVEDPYAVFELSKTLPDMKELARLAGKNRCDRIILSNDMWPEVPLTDLGYEAEYTFDTCTVYREVGAP